MSITLVFSATVGKARVIAAKIRQLKQDATQLVEYKIGANCDARLKLRGYVKIKG